MILKLQGHPFKSSKKNIYERSFVIPLLLIEQCFAQVKAFSFAVTSSGDNNGMLEGLLRGKKGLFPVHCVQEVRLRNPNSVKQLGITTAPRTTNGNAGKRFDSTNQQSLNSIGGGGSNGRHFATAQRAKDSM